MFDDDTVAEWKEWKIEEGDEVREVIGDQTTKPLKVVGCTLAIILNKMESNWGHVSRGVA